MDNMAYLQQIAGVDNSVAQQVKKNNDNVFKKIFNVWTILGTVLFIVILVIVAVVASSMNKVDTKDQDLMAQSYWTAYYLNEETLTDYTKLVKNSDIRNMSASLKSVLEEIIKSDNDIMKAKFGVEVSKMKPKTDEVPKNAEKQNQELNGVLEEARLNGILDRVFLREMTMQIAYLRAYQSEIAERTGDADAKAFATKAYSNLDNLYEQFHNFKSNTL